MKRTYMDLRVDVTRLTEKQRGSLAGQLIAQTEPLDDHDDDEQNYPGLEYEVEWNEVEDDEPRTVLLHLNVTVPPTDERDAGQISAAVEMALEVGMSDPDNELTNGLEVCIPLAEEV